MADMEHARAVYPLPRRLPNAESTLRSPASLKKKRIGPRLQHLRRLAAHTHAREPSTLGAHHLSTLPAGPRAGFARVRRGAPARVKAAKAVVSLHAEVTKVSNK